ncbi:Protein NLRC5 [Ilyonectria robusta]
MNKFVGPECTDYNSVAGQIQKMLKQIREGSPLEQADAWIRDKNYNADRLKIERLSGDLLSMDQCYINLAIVEQPGQDVGRSKEGDVTPSPFSLFARQKVETPDKTIQVELPTLFSQRVGRDGCTIQPRRILIRGRAGVGKTTLCKKIVYEFTQGTWSEWSKLFDRVLWVPLRNLKLEERRLAGYNFTHLFSDEYFSRPDDRPDLAKALSDALKTGGNRTLFLLDGLDEVSQHLMGEGGMVRFLNEDLLTQPNVVITSRPYGKPPAGLDLELETIGFYPDQVKAYLNADPKIKPRANEVQSFLQEHWLIQGLVRIPIQLDALCYTWEEFDQGTVPNTMTRIYQAIERRLWKKDAVRLDKMSEGHARSARPAEIERGVKTEIALLESLAFHGLHSDVIDFTPAHRDEIVDMFPLSGLPLDEALARLSFLRTSDSSSKVEDRNYHFIHLTFLEYFAARYFVQQWTSGKQLPVLKFGSRQERSSVTETNAREFLQKEKYNARYDIFWRFVAGLLHANYDEEQLCGFFRTIEDQPRDLLGPVHQRLVMHCLSEVVPSEEGPKFNQLRDSLEGQLKQWLLFECNLNLYRKGRLRFPSEMEFPESILEAVLLDESDDVRTNVLASLRTRPGISQTIINYAASLLRDEKSNVRCAAGLALARQSVLSEEVLQALVARLQDEESYVRHAAVRALGRQSALSEEVLQALVARLQDEELDVRGAAAEALCRLSALSEEVLQALVARLQDEESYVRHAAVRALGRQSALSEEVLQALVAMLQDENSDARHAAGLALARQSALSEEVLQALVARLQDEESDVRDAAVEALYRQSALSEEVLQALVAMLRDEESYVRGAAALALRRLSALPDDRFPSFLVTMDSQSFNELYGVWLRRSFSDHLTWYVEGKYCRINMPEGGRDVPFDQLKSAVQEAQVSLKVPKGVWGEKGSGESDILYFRFATEMLGISSSRWSHPASAPPTQSGILMKMCILLLPSSQSRDPAEPGELCRSWLTRPTLQGEPGIHAGLSVRLRRNQFLRSRIASLDWLLRHVTVVA